MRSNVIVADASVIVESLLGSSARAGAARSRLMSTVVHSPHLVDLEVAAALRRLTAAGRIPAAGATRALGQLQRMAIVRHSHTRFLPRIWKLRDSVSPYDAAYVAIAERADATLLTLDHKLAAAHGTRCRIEVLAV